MFISKVGLAILLAMASIKHVEPTCTITVQDDSIGEVEIDASATISSRVPKRARKGRTPRRDVDVSDCSNESDDDGFIAIVKNGKKSDFKVTKSKKKKKKKGSSMVEDAVDDSSPIIEKTFLAGEDANGNFVGIVKRNDGKMVGSMVDVENSEIVQITYDDDGKMHALVKSVDEFPPEGHAHTEDMNEESSFQKPFYPERFLHSSKSAFEFASSNMTNMISRNTAEDENTIIDVLVAWTQKAECFESGKSADCSVNDKTKEKMEDLIDLAVFETNQAYEESGVSITLELVHAYRSSITEASSDAFSKALSGIRYDEEAKSLREEHKADVVALIIQDPQYCGLGYIGPRKDLMFSVTARGCATGYYSFGHEIGHNMGLRHDLGTENACSASSSNYGWRDPNGNFRTIMGYNCRTDQCDKIKKQGCTRIPRFSTPRLTYEKKPLGATGKADNAAYLNANKDIVAGYFMEAGTCIEDSHCEQPSEQCFLNSCESGTCVMENWCETRKNICGTGKCWLEIDVLLDRWPQEVSWSLEKNNAEVISMEGASDDINEPLGTKEYNILNFASNDKYVCLDNGNYKFTIYDSYGDGLSSPGYYKILYEGMENEINGIGNYGSSATHDFTLGPQEFSTTSPTASPTGSPTSSPTSSPSASPSAAPTSSPTSSPSASPSAAPTSSPTSSPSASPSAAPTSSPTSSPSASPMGVPTSLPTSSPSIQPSLIPSHSPTVNSSVSLLPTKSSSSPLKSSPTGHSSIIPALTPSPSSAPSSSLLPSSSPRSASPTESPTVAPIINSTESPTLATINPSASTSTFPTIEVVTITTNPSTEMPTLLPTEVIDEEAANLQKCKSEQWKRYTKANEMKTKCKSLQKALQKKCENNTDEKKCKKIVRKRCKNDGNALEICPHTCQLQCFIHNI
ncbi:hypothetical protein CTEN210_14707 [Chaetoceros tenuissimus]|uniref:Peptidase M12B domain-containing protein n=1 Tax=Chaetoceros tenuissimus TaxID=426638 RepID=A0AAD3HCJ1_9STRA|nr:hypothetical protein CTEN210_14707 [Chaetoceros tenuissimus]